MFGDRLRAAPIHPPPTQSLKRLGRELLPELGIAAEPARRKFVRKHSAAVGVERGMQVVIILGFPQRGAEKSHKLVAIVTASRHLAVVLLVQRQLWPVRPVSPEALARQQRTDYQPHQACVGHRWVKIVPDDRNFRLHGRNQGGVGEHFFDLPFKLAGEGSLKSVSPVHHGVTIGPWPRRLSIQSTGRLAGRDALCDSTVPFQFVHAFAKIFSVCGDFRQNAEGMTQEIIDQRFVKVRIAGLAKFGIAPPEQALALGAGHNGKIVFSDHALQLVQPQENVAGFRLRLRIHRATACVLAHTSGDHLNDVGGSLGDFATLLDRLLRRRRRRGCRHRGGLRARR